MIKLYFAPRTRAVRVIWLLEELAIPYELVRVDFGPNSSNFFARHAPMAKIPVLEDGDAVMCESGAIVQYILERYGDGRLAPPSASPDRARFLQWMHFAEGTAYPPLGVLVWLTRYRSDSDRHEALVADAGDRASVVLDFLEEQLGESRYLLGDDFSAADVMVGFTLMAAKGLGELDRRSPRLRRYVARLSARPAYRVASAIL